MASSWVIWFFKTKFHLKDGMLGSLFFTTSIIAAASMLVASSIAKRFGNIKVRTKPLRISNNRIDLFLDNGVYPPPLRHLPRSDPNPQLSSLCNHVHRPPLLHTIHGCGTSFRLLGSCRASTRTNRSHGRHQRCQDLSLFWVAFVTAGSLKATYDLGMLAVFAGHKTREEQDEEQRQAEEAEMLRESEDPNER
jgi:hypothetical protein